MKNILIILIVVVILSIVILSFVFNNRESTSGFQEKTGESETGIESPSKTFGYDPDLIPETTEENDPDVNFETIFQGSGGGRSEAGRFVIRGKEEWEEVFGNSDSLADVDFEKEIVIAVFMRERNTGGYSITITRIIETENQLQVFVEEKSPGFNDFVIQVFTYPSHVVKTKATDKDIVFVQENSEKDVDQPGFGF